MPRTSSLLLLSLALCQAVLPIAAQKFQPKTIQFSGAPEYTSEELMAAAGLKKGAVLSNAEMGDHSKALMDTGMFDNLSYKFDGQDLTYSLTPAEHLYPVQFQNIPLATGPALDAKLHAQFPLYHGRVPSEGGMLDGVRAALEQNLAADGIQATVTATPAAPPGSHKAAAMSFSITSPPVRASVLHIDGPADADQAKVQALVAVSAKIPYDTAATAGNFEHSVETYYQDRGYAEASVKAVRSGNAQLDSGVIIVPYSMHIEPGPIYKLGAVHLPEGAPITQADVDKVLAPKPGGPVDGVRVRTLWQSIAAAYRTKGYLDCKIVPHPEFDKQAGIVNYTAEINPGPIYHLAFVKFDNVSDQLRALLLKNWQMLPGDPFDPGYVSTFMIKAQQTDPVLQRTLAGIKTKFDVAADPQSHEVTVVIRLEK